jgi:hypothetical protein
MSHPVFDVNPVIETPSLPFSVIEFRDFPARDAAARAPLARCEYQRYIFDI